MTAAFPVHDVIDAFGKRSFTDHGDGLGIIGMKAIPGECAEVSESGTVECRNGLLVEYETTFDGHGIECIIFGGRRYVPDETGTCVFDARPSSIERRGRYKSAKQRRPCSDRWQRITPANNRSLCNHLASHHERRVRVVKRLKAFVHETLRAM